MRLKIDGILLNIDGNIQEFDSIEKDKNDIKCYRNGNIAIHFQGVDFSKFKIINQDGTEVPLIKEEKDNNSNLEYQLNQEMIQSSLKYELIDLQQDKKLIEEKASGTIEDISNKLDALVNKDNSVKEDITCIKDSIKSMLDNYDNRFRTLEKNISSLDNSLYNVFNKLKEIEKVS